MDLWKHNRIQEILGCGLLVAVAEWATRRNSLRRAKPESIAKLVRAFAICEVRNTTLFAAVARQLVQPQTLEQFTTADIARTRPAIQDGGISGGYTKRCN